MKKKIRDDKGFTLMELLCTIGIIVILAAIGMPTFDGNAEKAREARDLSNIRTAVALVANSASSGAAIKGTTYTTSGSSAYYQALVRTNQKKMNWQTKPGTKKLDRVTVAGSTLYTYEPGSFTGWTVRFYTEGKYENQLKYGKYTKTIKKGKSVGD